MIALMQLNAVSAVCRGWEGVNTGPQGDAAAETWFDATRYLGKRGHRFLSRPVKYTLAAAHQMADRIAGDVASGLYLGTSSADTEHRRQVMHGIRTDEAALPGAASAPGASANGPTGALARSYRVYGPAMTLTGGDDSGLICLWQAASAMGRGEIRDCVIGQVEAVPGAAGEDGAVLWTLRSAGAAGPALAVVGFCDWQRIAPGASDALRARICAEPGPVTLIAHDSPDLTAMAKDLATRAHPPVDLEFLSTDRLNGTIASDMQLFSLLTLAILNGSRGRILILSQRGHLFSLTVKPKGTDNA